MPKEEVWIKIGGDHGGGSFKLSFQIANTLHPNAVRSTVPFLVFSAPDSVDNLATAIKPYTAQIQQLQHSMWEGKSVRCTFFGDYELICACYGLSGASGKRPCLYCHFTKADNQLPLAEQPPCVMRTLEGLAADLEQFQADGARLSRAKHYNNVIRSALIPIPLEWVCIPALHLDLGIFAWMFDAFLADTRQLDAVMASHVDKNAVGAEDSATFVEAVRISTDLQDKSELQHELQTQVNHFQDQVCIIYSLNERSIVA